MKPSLPLKPEDEEQMRAQSEVYARTWPGDQRARKKRARHFRSGFAAGVAWKAGEWKRSYEAAVQQRKRDEEATLRRREQMIWLNERLKELGLLAPLDLSKFRSEDV